MSASKEGLKWSVPLHRNEGGRRGKLSVATVVLVPSFERKFDPRSSSFLLAAYITARDILSGWEYQGKLEIEIGLPKPLLSISDQFTEDSRILLIFLEANKWPSALDYCINYTFEAQLELCFTLMYKYNRIFLDAEKSASSRWPFLIFKLHWPLAMSERETGEEM